MPLFLLKDNRNFPRVEFHGGIRCQRRGYPDTVNTLCDDISSGGLSIRDQCFRAPQSIVMLEVTVLSRLLALIGKVAWSAPRPHSNWYRTGIEFIDMNEQDKRFLDEYVNLKLNRI